MICNDFEEDSIRMRSFDDDFNVIEKAADSSIDQKIKHFSR